MTDVFQFRQAVARSRVLLPLIQELDEFNSDDLGSAVAQIIGASAVAPYADTTPRSARAAVTLIRLYDEIAWYTEGIRAGYYADTDAWDVVPTSYAAQFLRVVEETQPFWPPDRPPAIVDDDEYETELTLARGRLTSAFLECARLILFADEDEWRVRFEEVQGLLSFLAQHPGASVAGPTVDRLCWALTGADNLTVPLEPQGALASQLEVLITVHATDRDRLSKLLAVRTAIAETWLSAAEVSSEPAAPRGVAYSRARSPRLWRNLAEGTLDRTHDEGPSPFPPTASA